MDESDRYNCQLFTVEDSHYLLTNGPDYISRVLRNGIAWETDTLAIGQRLIEGISAPVLLDIGANLGAWSVPMGIHIRRSGGKLHAWEPQRQVYYQLCANLFINNLTHCFAHHGAIGDYAGEIDVPVLDVMQDANLGALSLLPEVYKFQREQKSEYCETAPITTLDLLNLPRADLIKIDVEGMEYEVLAGGKNWLEQMNYPPVIFEVWSDAISPTKRKQEKLIAMMCDEMQYEVVLLGELAVAQHKNHTRLNITLHKQGYSLAKPTHFGMSFLP